MVEVSFEIDEVLKLQAEKVCAEYGLTIEDAVVLFFKQVVRLQRLPFELDADLEKYVESQKDLCCHGVERCSQL